MKVITRVALEGPPIKAAASWRRENGEDIVYNVFGRGLADEELKEGKRGRWRTEDVVSLPSKLPERSSLSPADTRHL